MGLIGYLLGLCLFMAYQCCRLDGSVIRENIETRFARALICSVFWFIALPYEIFSGRLWMSQREVDDLTYGRLVKHTIDDAIYNTRKSLGKLSDEDEQKMRDSLEEQLGSLEDVLNDCEYFTKSITEDQLAGLIAYEFSQSKVDKRDLVERYEEVSPMEFVEKCVRNIPVLSKRIEDDLSYLGIDDTYNSVRYNMRSPFANLLGFQTLRTGLTFYGVEIKSKETLPLFIIIYYDGMMLRAYIPPHNLFNKETIQPFGVDEDADLLFLEDVLQEECMRSSMYRDYSERIDLDHVLRQIELTVNYLPLTGQMPRYGWDDIKIEELS